MLAVPNEFDATRRMMNGFMINEKIDRSAGVQKKYFILELCRKAFTRF